ncbi:MAG TPA: hypothetical protein PK564_03355, partial [bacterium]|nr:hypothetical protein [bacterium]
KLSRLAKKKKDSNIETPKSVDEPIQQAIDNSKEQGVKDDIERKNTYTRDDLKTISEGTSLSKKGSEIIDTKKV